MTNSDLPVVIVSVSGGKDSTACALLALDKYGVDNCQCVFADTGNEHELTYQYINDYLPHALGVTIDTVKSDFTDRIAAKRQYIIAKWPQKNVPDKIIYSALDILAKPTGNPFLDLCLWKGRFPSRKAQFCTQELKRYPLDNYMLELMAEGHQVQSWQGVRRDESIARRNLPHTEPVAEGWWIIRPIIDWTAKQVIEYVTKTKKIQLNPLYTLGMSRVGCMPCINANKSEIAEIAKRFPEHISKIRIWEGIVAYAAKRGFSTFFTSPAGRSKTSKPGYVYRPDEQHPGLDWVESDKLIRNRLNIDARVEWAMTTRGGKQFDLLKSAPPEPCSSVYGLCE